MKLVLKILLKIIRSVLGAMILFFDRAFPPRPLSRAPGEQAKADALAKAMALYQFEACPFCVKVRRALRRMSLPVELRDAGKNPHYAEELVVGGGKLQVPCLHVREGSPEKDRWIYESGDIVAYLQERLRQESLRTLAGG